MKHKTIEPELPELEQAIKNSASLWITRNNLVDS